MENKTTRRVVTGNNSEGKSYFVLDGPTPGRFDLGVLQSDEIWIDEPGRPGPQDSANSIDIDAYKLLPPEGGIYPDFQRELPSSRIIQFILPGIVVNSCCNNS